MAKSNAWRPDAVTPEVLSKLEEWFAMWFTDVECCLYANIASATLYRYVEKNPEFRERKEHLKDQPKMKAKLNIVKSIDAWDKNDSRWYLERKSKEEFSTKEVTENTNTNVDVTEDLTEEQRAAIAGRFKK